MDADHCVCCGAIIPEGTQVCVDCLNGCVGCPWENKDNCKACRGQKGANKDAENNLHS